MSADHEHEAPFGEGDPRAWDRPIRESELYLPDRKDVFNFIDETKVKYLRQMLPASGTAVEVGAGSGRLLIRLGLERPYRLIAVDYAPYAIRAVQENYRRAGVHGEAIFADTRYLPLDDGSMDVVLSGGLLEHFRDPGEVVREMARLLRRGGLFYADIVPRKISLYRWAERHRMAHDEHLAEGIFESDLPKHAWAQVVRDAGLADVRIVSAGVYPPPHRVPNYESWLWRWPRLFRALDATPLADKLGWFYMVTARKP